ERHRATCRRPRRRDRAAPGHRGDPVERRRGRAAAGPGAAGRGEVRRGRPDGRAGGRRDRAAGGGAGAGPPARRGGRARRGRPRRHPALRLRVPVGDRGADPGRAGRAHAGRQRRADLRHPGAGGRPVRRPRQPGGQGLRGDPRRAGHRPGAARAATSARPPPAV
ncbi:MAG: 6,7-dimethyl-8-ribityllumazine synthase, partial [uncultured Corynebacteriales bacterium]